MSHAHPPTQYIRDPQGPDQDEHHVHAVPPRILIGVYLLLVVLTVVTVAAAKVDLGQANIWVALGIAVIKSSFVALYFMHLRWDSPFNGVALIAAFFFVSLFIGLAMLDSHAYQPILKPTPIATVPKP
jgi:cytochrome c oxidase subunit 4